MKQETVGTVTHNGVTYEIDWRYHEENGEITAAENAAYIFLKGRQITEFANPRQGVDGWKNKGEVLFDAHRYLELFLLGKLPDGRG